MSWGMVAVAGAGLVAGAMSSNASKSAASDQVGAANAATASQQGMFDRTVDLNAPFRSSGVNAMAKLNSLMGIGPNTAAAGAPGGTFDPASINVPTTFQPGQSGDPLWEKILQQYNDASTAQFGTGMNRSWTADPDAQRQYQQLKQQYLDAKQQEFNQNAGATSAAGGGGGDPQYGSLLKPFSMDDFHLDPGIQFQTQQGNLALTNSAAAKNGVLSGGALKDFIAYNQGMAGTGYQSAYDRYMANKQFTLGSLMDMTHVGQASANNTASTAPSFASGIAGTITGAGNARAAGQIGSANAISGGVTGAGNAYFLSRLMGRNGSEDIGGPVTTSANPNGVYLAPDA